MLEALTALAAAEAPEPRHIHIARYVVMMIAMISFGGYLVFVAVYCYRHGEGYWTYGPIKRKDSPVGFFLFITIFALSGAYIVWQAFSIGIPRLLE